MRLTLPFVAAAIVVSVSASGAFAKSEVQKECSAKYQAAKAGSTLNGMTYNQFYSQCAAEAKAAKGGGTTPAATAPAPAAPAPAPATPTSAPAAPAAPPTTTAARPPAAAPAAAAAAGAAVFPTAIAPEFSKLKPFSARMKTCGQQWEKDKTNGTTGGMKWNPKGGGYMSECNRRLKG